MSTRYSSAVIIFKQGTPPDQSSDIIPWPGDMWMDLSQSPPITKKCTAMNPYTWVSIEGGGGGGGPNFSDEEIPSGSINGTNTGFTLANSPSPNTSLLLFLNGVLQFQGSSEDYTLSGSSITFVAAPQTGDILLAWYRH